MPEDRYRSGAGLAADLRRCLTEWRASGSIMRFVLGRHDISEQFLLPQRLYGRDVQIAAMLGDLG